MVVSAGMDYLVVSGWAELFDAHRENRKRFLLSVFLLSTIAKSVPGPSICL